MAVQLCINVCITTAYEEQFFIHDGCQRHGNFLLTKIFSGCCHLFFSQPPNKETRSTFFFLGGGGAETPHHQRVVDRSHGGTSRSADRCRPHDPTA
jgi:hypothetical protein